MITIYLPMKTSRSYAAATSYADRISEYVNPPSTNTINFALEDDRLMPYTYMHT